MTSLLESTLESDHQRIREFADAAEAAVSSAEEPRIRHRLSDTFSAVLSRHLAAVEDVLLPAVKSSTAYGRESVRDYVRHVRVLEKVLHELKARVYGAGTADSDWDAALARDRPTSDSLAQREAALVEQLRESLSAHETRQLAHRFTAAEERAPTRPHAYTPHTGWRGRIARRLGALPTGSGMKPRGGSSPIGRQSHRHEPDSLMHRYFTGAPASSDRRSAEAQTSRSCLRTSVLSTLPTFERGRSSQTSTCFGAFTDPIFSLTNAMRSSGIQGLARAQDDDRGDALAPFLVRQADDRTVGDGVVCHHAPARPLRSRR